MAQKDRCLSIAEERGRAASRHAAGGRPLGSVRLLRIRDERRLVRKHDVIFIPPGVAHAIHTSGLVDLIFIVVTTPVEGGR